MARSSNHDTGQYVRRDALRLFGGVAIAVVGGCTSTRNGNGAGGYGGGGDGGGGGGSPTDARATALETSTGIDEGETTTTETVSPTRTSGGTAIPTTSPTVTPFSRTVTLTNTSFEPIRLEVPTGTTVTWVNEDSFGHDVTAATFHDAAVGWDIAVSLGPADSTSYTFEDPGVYEYYCTIHGRTSMCGVVLVGDATLKASLPCEFGDESY